MIRVRALTKADWSTVRGIYGQGIEDGEATFEAAVPSWEAFDRAKLTHSRLVAVDDEDTVIGWVAASAVSARAAYRGVVEHSVYVDRAARGSGVGRLLLEAFISAAEQAGVWTIQSSIFPENTASLRLHEAAGFRVIGRRERIARSAVGPRAGQWRDTVLIERRSARNGVEDEHVGTASPARVGGGMTDKPTVLFVCVHNAGRSQMAAGFLSAIAGDRIDVMSAGSEPKDAINPVTVRAMAEVGIDIAGQTPKVLTVDAVKESDVVITMGCGDACPIFPGKRYEDWDLDDPAGRPLVEVRPIRDEIRGRVEALVAELLPAAG